MNTETKYYEALLELVENKDKVIADAIRDELNNQKSRAKLIASENFSSIAVHAAVGANILSDKYAEGYVDPDGTGHRYYSGCENINKVEARANQLACELFGAEHTYSQCPSGCSANESAFWAVISTKVVEPKFKEIQEAYKSSVNKRIPQSLGDLTREEWNYVREECHKQKLLSLSLNSGGHLTHSSPMNIVNQMFEVYTYDVNNEGFIDYDEIYKKAMEVKPLILLAGFSAYPRNLNFKKFREIANACGAVLMVDMAHFAGLVAGKQLVGEYNPVPYADIVTSTTHKTLRGPRGGLILCKDWLAKSVDTTCPRTSGGPMGNSMAAKAIAFGEALKPEFQDYAKQIILNSKACAKAIMDRGVKLLTGGTDNHMFIINLSNLPITGKQAEDALLDCDIVTNRNSVPNDPEKPNITSGIRVGVPALTTRGLKEEDMIVVGNCIVDVLQNTKPVVLDSGAFSKQKYTIDPAIVKSVKARIAELLEKYPLYPELDLD